MMRIHCPAGTQLLTQLADNIETGGTVHFSRNKGHHTNGGGSGWSREGNDKYKELFQAVIKDRNTCTLLYRDRDQEMLRMRANTVHRRLDPKPPNSCLKY